MANGKKNQTLSQSSDSADLTDDVINQLGIEDDPDDRDNDNDPDETGEREESDYEEADEPQDDEEDEEDSDSEGEEGEDEEDSPQDRRRNREDGQPVKLTSDKRGNLVDPRTGKIVAPAGAARRFYEDLQRERVRSNKFYQEIGRRDRVMQQAASAMRELQTKLNQAEQGNGLAKQLGLDQNDATEALTFYSKFKNPATALESLKYILTKAAQRGIDIKPLGAGQGAIDPAALTQSITNELNQKLDPIANRLQAEQEQEQARREVAEEIRNFVDDNPESEQYLPVLGKIVANPQFRGIGLQGAWLMLQNYLLRKRLTGGLPRQQRQRQGERRPRFSGHSRPGAAVRGRERGEIDDSPMNVDMDFKDIVQSVIKDYGTPA